MNKMRSFSRWSCFLTAALILVGSVNGYASETEKEGFFQSLYKMFFNADEVGKAQETYDLLASEPIPVPSSCSADQSNLNAFSKMRGYVHACRDLMLDSSELINFYDTKKCITDINTKFREIPSQDCKDTMLTGSPGGIADVNALMLNGYLTKVIVSGTPGNQVFNWDNGYDDDGDGIKDTSHPNFIPYVQHYFSLVGEWYSQTRGVVYENSAETAVMSAAQSDFLEFKIMKEFWDSLQDFASEWRATFGEIPAELAQQKITGEEQTEKLFEIFQTLLKINNQVLENALSSELAAGVFEWKENDTNPSVSPVLALIIGDTLAPFYERVRTLTKIYDVACKLNSCNDEFYQLNETVWMLRFFDQLGQGDVVEEFVFDSGDTRPLSLFIQTLYRSRDFLKEAIAKINEVFDVDNIVSIYPGSDFPHFLQSFHKVFAESHDLVANYESTKETRVDGQVKAGFFHGGNISMVNVGFGEVNMRRHIDSVKTVNNQLDILSQSFVAKHNQLINQTVSINSSEVSLSDLRNQIDSQMNDVVSHSNQIEAIRSYIQEQNEQFADVIKQIIEDTVTTNTLVKVGDTITYNIDAAASGEGDGTFSSIPKVQLEFPSGVPPISKGDLLRVQVEGEYQPNCAITSAFGGKAANARTGARGYTTVFSNGESQVKSTSKYAGVEAYVDVSVSKGFEVPGKTFSASVRAGIRASAGIKTSNTKSHSTRSDSSFDVGLTLPNTPYPTSPAGALLLVEMPDSEDDKWLWKSVNTLSPGKTVVVQEGAGTLNPSKLYLVVNDCGAGASGQLTVNIDRYQATSNVANSFISKVIAITSDLETQVRGLIDNGVLSQRTLSSLREQLAGSTGGIEIDAFSGNIRHLLSAFLEAQIAILDYKSQISNMEREMQVKMQRLDSLADHLDNETDQKFLKISQRNWNLANMDLDFVNREGTNRNLYTLNRVISILEHSLVSYLDFKYDEDSKRAIIGDISLLTRLSFASPFDDIATNMTTFMSTLLDNLEDDLNNKPLTPKMTMGLHIPNPYYIKPTGFPDPVYNFPNMNRPDSLGVMDTFRAKQIWDQIYAWKRGQNGSEIKFDLTHEDLYTTNGLACYVEAPIIDSVGLYFIPENEGYITDFNNLYRHRNAKLHLSGLSLIPFEEKQRQYNFTNDDWRYMDAAVRMAKSPEDAIHRLATEFPPNSNVESGVGTGRSPFGFFQVGDIPAYKYDSATEEVLLGDTPLNEIKELFVAYVFAASSNDFSVNMNWMKFCSPEGSYWRAPFRNQFFH